MIVLLSLLLIASPAFCEDKPLTNITYDGEYDLFYQEPYHLLMPQVQREVPRAYRRIHRLWGLTDTGGLRYPLLVQVKDVPSKTLRRWEAAYVESRTSGNQLTQKLVVSIGAYRDHPDEDLTDVVTHEMAHVILNDWVAGARSTPVPPWFHEGVAQSVTSEGRDRVRADLRALALSDEKLHLCELDGPLDEFAHGPFNGNCYPEFYLAVQRFRQLGGRDALQKAFLGLQQGTRMPELVVSITGKDWRSFKKDATEYTESVFSGLKPIP